MKKLIEKLKIIKVRKWIMIPPLTSLILTAGTLYVCATSKLDIPEFIPLGIGISVGWLLVSTALIFWSDFNTVNKE